MVDKPTAWYDPSNGMVSTDRDSPLFTPLGQVWPLCLKREWVGLTDDEIWEAYMESPVELNCTTDDLYAFSRIIETKVKEKI
jgi:hypothetical protein